MRFDDLEFLISQYADGTLDPERVPEVEAVLRRDPYARELLESYQGLDSAFDAAARAPSPEVPWDDLHARISRQVAALASGPASVGELPEEVEAQLVGYADGSLTAAESRLVEARLAADPHARMVVASYTTLERAFDAMRADRPAVRWADLGEHLSGAIDAATGQSSVDQSASVADQPMVAAQAPAADLVPSRSVGVPSRSTAGSYNKMDAYRSADGSSAERVTTTAAANAAVDRFSTLRGAQPAKAGTAGRIGRWLAEPRRLAVAACLLVAGSVSFQLLKGGGGSPAGTGGPSQVVAPNVGGGIGGTVAQTPNQPSVVIPVPVVPNGTGGANPGADTIANVQVGPPPNGVDRAALDAYGDTTAAARQGPGSSSLVAKDRSAAAQDHARKNANDSAAAFPR